MEKKKGVAESAYEMEVNQQPEGWWRVLVRRRGTRPDQWTWGGIYDSEEAAARAGINHGRQIYGRAVT